MASIYPKELRCEYKKNPLGIDEREPRLSWVLEMGQENLRGAKQTAYQIIVATSRDKLERNEADLWDSGKVESDQTAQIEYKGKELKSEMECWWKVRVWDEEGNPSEWSEPAFWTMGLLDREEWKGKWIGYDAPFIPQKGEEEKARASHFLDCFWIWYPEGEGANELPEGKRFFRRKFIVPSGKVKKAVLAITADDRFIAYLNGERISQGENYKNPQIIEIGERIREGENVLSVEAENLSSGPAGLICKLRIEMEDEEIVSIVSDGSWKVSKEAGEDWGKLEFDDSKWENARELARFGEAPWGWLTSDNILLLPTPYLRKAFEAGKPVRRAYLYVSALGICEVYINGRRVGKDYFVPGWSDYRKRVYYRTYDVKELLRQGENAIGVILADGWYSGYLDMKGRGLFGSTPKLLLQLNIEYEDGSRVEIVSDESWKASYGAIREADLYMGETYDARLEMPGWCEPGFDDSLWDKARVFNQKERIITAHPGVPVRKQMELKPIKISEPKPGIYVVDMGQNMVGWARIKAKGEKGRKIVLRYAEMLKPDGMIYTENLRTARCTDAYIKKGDGEEIWEPRFTFRGFRYVEVSGYPERLLEQDIVGVVVSSDMRITGEFVCSDERVNRLFQNIVWGQRGNYLEVPTDCPQRDERLGWTGDAQIFLRTATYNMDVASFITKWLVDLVDSQNEEGAYAHVAPDIGLGSDSPAWTDAGIICPYILYKVYGDKRILERNYPSMARYIEYLKRRSKDYLQPPVGYGDWLSVEADTPKDLIATAYFAYVVSLMEEIARVLGKEEDRKSYSELKEKIKEAFNKEYVLEDGRIKGETQTAYVLALDFGLLPEEKIPLAIKHLVEDIRKRNNHLSTGFLGAKPLLPILTRYGYVDLAYTLLLQDTFPSWLYMVKQGATTIWERWDGWTEEKGFQDPGMNSFNHYAFGSVGEWMFGMMAGIDMEEPGYRKIRIKPHPDPEGRIAFVKAKYESISGLIKVEWSRDEDGMVLAISIPANATAKVYVPAGEDMDIWENGQPPEEREGIKFVGREGDRVVYEVASGEYLFQIERKVE
ncbi:MAG: family 78 glycoside hydrolase catalytic domain [bacterium]